MSADYRTAHYNGYFHLGDHRAWIHVTTRPADEPVVDFSRQELAELVELAEQAWPGLAAQVAAEAADRQAVEQGLHPFNPDWTIAPGVTLAHWLREMNMSASVLAVACAGQAAKTESLRLIQEVLDRKPLTGEHARLLEYGTQVPVRFWLALEHNYRTALAAGKTDVSDQ